MSDDTPTAGRPVTGRVRTDQEHGDALTLHLAEIREARAEVEKAKAPVKRAKELLTAAQDELTKRFNAAKVDLGREYSREYMESLLKDGEAKTRDLVGYEKRRARDKQLLGQPVFGVQAELFPGEETPTAARDEMAWEAEGYLRGLRGALQEIQDGDPPTFHQAILRGYEKGQAETRERVARAMEAKAQQGQPDADQPAVDLNPPEPEAPEPGSPEAKAAERKAIRKAKESLGVKPTANRVPA